MTGEIVRGEEGQALVIVALAMVVLMGSIALSVDWGYSLLTRRGAQNEAEAAALGAGRYLASSYVGGLSPFDVSQERVWCEARQRRDLSVHTAPAALTRSLAVAFYSSSGSLLATISSANCPPSAGTDVPATTALLRVQTATTYSSLFGAVTSQPIRVSTAARVRLTGGTGVRPLQLWPFQSEIPGVGLSGSTTTPNVAIWPLIKHFDATDYSGLPCGQYCDATARISRRFTLFPDAPRFGTFSGLVTYSHFSPHERSALSPDTVHQVITESDYTGTSSGHHGHPSTGAIFPPATGTCGGLSWDTIGSADPSQAAPCDIPNWFRYGYRGSLSIGTDWNDGSWAGFEAAPRAVELPNNLPASRASCSGGPSYFPMPSCTGTPSLIGDWVETVPGDMTPLMATQMIRFVQEYGRLAPNGGGLAVVVHVFLWDCAQTFSAGQPAGRRWASLGPVGDLGDGDQNGCVITRRPTRTRSVDRVHLVSVVPVTVYLSDVLTSGSTVTVYAYWGDVFGDAGACALTTPPAGCGLNPLINSAFLVSDD
jgi:hypothetical protein